MLKKLNLIVIHRGGPEFERDFGEICGKVESLDPEIAACATDIQSVKSPIPAADWQRPTLVVALQREFRLKVPRGAVLCNYEIEKLVQTEILQKAGLPAPPAASFRFGMKLDPILFGEFVLLKPMNLRMTSKGTGVQAMRRTRLENLRPSDLPKNHPLHQVDGYIVQKLVDTGRFPTTYRVATFLGEVLYGLRYQSTDPSPELASPDNVIEAGNFTQKGQRKIDIFADEDLFSLARKVAGAFDKVPLLGIDFVRDRKSSQPSVLEVNPGGNTWHFSSQMWAERRRQSPELIRSMKRQLSAFDAAARGLAGATRRLAS